MANNTPPPPPPPRRRPGQPGGTPLPGKPTGGPPTSSKPATTGGIAGGTTPSPPVPGAEAAGKVSGAAAVGKAALDETVEAAQAAKAGDVGGVADSAIRGTATAAATYFGTPVAGSIVSGLLRSRPGRTVTKGTRYTIVGVVVASLLLPMLLGVAIIGGMAAMFGGAASVAAACAGPSGATPLENPTQEQVAASIYAQATGLGLGEVAAIIAIGTGYGETGLQNDTDGDCWGGSCSNGHTSSRGVFQQFYSWPPKGTAWSGTTYGPTSGGDGTDFGGFNASNAWGLTGWATMDPRMNVAQAANMFFLGPDYGATMGLEDNKLFQSLRTKDPLSLSSAQMVQVAQQVQQFPVDHMVSYEQNMTQATAMFKRIKSGEIPLPSFTPPLPEMLKSATTDITKEALAGITPAAAPSSAPAARARNASLTTSDTTPTTTATAADNGLLLLGDSLAAGIATESGVFPVTAYGGPTVNRTQVGITTSAALTKWAQDIKTGPNRILVSLGANNYGDSNETYGKQIDQLMQAAGPQRQVYWFTQHYSKSAHFNATLQAKAAQYPNLTAVDITALLGSTSGYTSPVDGYLHPNVAGYAAMWNQAEIAMGGATAPAPSECVGGVASGPLAVNPGSTPLVSQDSVAPAYGFSLNLPGGRNMTYYSQADGRWNGGSGYDFAQCGCGTTSLAMIIATLAGRPEYTPLAAGPEQSALGGVTGGYPNGCGSYHAPSVKLLGKYGLNYRYVPGVNAATWEAVKQTLRDGGLALLSVRGPTAFYNGAGHFVVIRGVAPDGRFLIADPNGLITGPSNSLSRGYTPSEITVNSGITLVLPAGKAFPVNV